MSQNEVKAPVSVLDVLDGLFVDWSCALGAKLDTQSLWSSLPPGQRRLLGVVADAAVTFTLHYEYTERGRTPINNLRTLVMGDLFTVCEGDNYVLKLTSCHSALNKFGYPLPAFEIYINLLDTGVGKIYFEASSSFSQLFD